MKKSENYFNRFFIAPPASQELLFRRALSLTLILKVLHKSPLSVSIYFTYCSNGMENSFSTYGQGEKAESLLTR